MARALLIIDPQYDFIDGSLPVPGAAEAMDALSRHVAATDYPLTIITCDSHPRNHCSFAAHGGDWPAHCVAHTRGAAIWDGLASAVFASPGEVHILTKGRLRDAEEYSIWKAADSASILDSLIAENAIDSIDVCGIAGDICVLNTLADGISRHGAEKFRVLKDFCPSLDGGAALAGFCAKEGVCIR